MASGMRSSAWVPLLSCATLALSSTRPSAAERRPEGVTPEIERMIATGVNYLVRTQNRDGCWNNMGGWGTYPTAMTALAGTGILMSGSTPT